jgi:hypothetical protein
MSERRPSERFCKHGFLSPNQEYIQDAHKYTTTDEEVFEARMNGQPYIPDPNIDTTLRDIRERCAGFYTEEEIQRMRNEIKVAECGICLEEITTTENCRCCREGHKFHTTCLDQYWLRNPLKNHFCPTTNGPTVWLQRCSSIYDIHIGGKRKHKKSRKYNKKRKSKKYSNKGRKTQKTRK